MKRFLLCAVAVMMLYSCGDSLKEIESDFMLKVTGTESTKFSGHYSFMEAGATPAPKNVSGTTPAEYSGRGVMAVCLFRKVAAEGTLKVQILKNGEKIVESDTSSPFGVVSLRTPLPDRSSMIGLLLSRLLGK